MLAISKVEDSEDKLVYRSIGVASGQLIPVVKDWSKAILVDAATVYPVRFTHHMRYWLQKQEQFPPQEVRAWAVYPKFVKVPVDNPEEGQKPYSHRLGFDIFGAITDENYNPSVVGTCQVRGLVKKQYKTHVTLEIQSNSKKKIKFGINIPIPQGWRGGLQGWFCEFNCKIENGQLTILDYQKIKQLVEPKKKKFTKPSKPSGAKGKPKLKNAAPITKPVKKEKQPGDKPKKLKFEAR